MRATMNDDVVVVGGGGVVCGGGKRFLQLAAMRCRMEYRLESIRRIMTIGISEVAV